MRTADIHLRIGADTRLRKAADTSSAYSLTFGLRMTLGFAHRGDDSSI
jgi:hypothetical protein